MIHLHPHEVEGYCTEINTYTFATNAIYELLYEKHHVTIKNCLGNNFNQGFGATRGSPAGLIIEKVCLRSDPIQGIHHITALTDHPRQCKTLNIPTPPCFVDFTHNPPLVQKNVLYVPVQKNFASGDAFYLNEENELIVFQVTVEENHPVEMSGLNNICDKFSNHTILNYHLVFVVPSNGQLNSRQNMHTSEGKVATIKSDEVKKFETNQWLFTYRLPVPVYQTQYLLPQPTIVTAPSMNV